MLRPSAALSPLTSPLLTREGFSHAFFTREGGVSEGPHASLSFAYNTGDVAAHVDEAFSRAEGFLGVQPGRLFVVSQVHGRAVQPVREGAIRPDLVRCEADALVTLAPGHAVGVRVADCVPILIACPRTGAVAAVHAGWRGAVADVCAAALGSLRELSGGALSPIAAVGPHISVEAFEVGPEVAAEIEAASPCEGVIVRREGQKPHADLRRMVEAQLRRAGCVEVDHVAGCTFGDAARFFSFRRDGKHSGRHVAAIVARTPHC